MNPLRILVVLAVGLLLAAPAPAGDDRYRVETDKPLELVLEDLAFAIAGANFRLVGRSRIGEALAEDGASPLPGAVVLHFCNLDYARRFLTLDPDSLLEMPCRISVHSLGDRVVIQARLLDPDHPDTGELGREVNAIMRRMVDEGAR